MATRSLINMNNHVLCAIDVETTGTVAGWNEIIQISAIPLDSEIKPLLGAPFFDMKIKPVYKDRINWEVCKVTKRDMQDICDTGHDASKVLDLFEYWFNNLNLGADRKLVPLGHNYSFDKTFIEQWMGGESYNAFFHGFIRDTMGICTFMNDRADVHGEQIPFPKLKLGYVCNKLGVEYLASRSHDSLYDCFIVAEVYRKLLWELIAN